MSYLYLAAAIFSEVCATSALKAAAGFTRPGPSAVVVVGYAAAFYSLSQAIKTIPLGVAYAVWSGVGTALLAGVGFFFYRQRLDVAGFVGIGLILAGVVVLNVFSQSTGHS
jgi:small multidrug resistance pump